MESEVTTTTSILIVDDESSVREVLSRLLEEAGYGCRQAACVDDALKIMEDGGVEMVLSDIMMPGRSGVDLLGEVSRRWPDTAVIMLTAVADTQTAIQAMKMGASDYILKPFNIEQVRMSVERAFEKRNLVLANREYRQYLEQKLEEQTAELRETFLGAVQALAEALEAKDPYTNGHSRRVTEIAVTLASEMGMTPGQVAQVRLAGMVHDIGKIGVPEEILHKPGRLSNDEFLCIEEHSAIGERILKPIIRDDEVLAMVRYHHEKFTGGGYPEGIAGEQIPIGARLLAVADAFDAMTSSRPYRRALSVEVARQQLRDNSGTQFDPEVVDLFMRAEAKLPFCPFSVHMEGNGAASGETVETERRAV